MSAGTNVSATGIGQIVRYRNRTDVGVVGVIDPSGTFCRLSRANLTVWPVLLDLIVNGSTALMQTSPHGRNWSNRIRPAATPISALRSCSMLGVELSVDASGWEERCGGHRSRASGR